MSGLCEMCLNPGHCCQRMVITGGSPGREMHQPMSLERAEHLAFAHRLPFVPGAQLPDGSWYWACYQLQSDGRCGIYETRPQLCRDYEAGSSPLCVHYVDLAGR